MIDYGCKIKTLEGKEMKKEKEGLFEEQKFEDVQYAKDVLEASGKKKEKCKIGLIVALVSTILAAGGYALAEGASIQNDVTEIMILIGWIGAIASYIIGGGLKVALSTALKITKLGWFLVPIFPIDLVVAIFAFFLAIISFFFIPVLYVGINYIQINKDYSAAEEYLKYCK